MYPQTIYNIHNPGKHRYSYNTHTELLTNDILLAKTSFCKNITWKGI